MNSLEEIKKRRKLLQYLSLFLIALDLMIYCCMETIDILYTFKDEEYLHKLTLFIVKIISTISFIVFLFVMICLKFISTLLMGAIVYLLVGVISFCYIVMEQLKSFPLSIEARPIAYYTNDIGSLLAILNVLTGITRTSAGVMILFYIVTLKFENKTKQEEKLKLLAGSFKAEVAVNSLNDPLIEYEEDERIVANQKKLEKGNENFEV